jgi:uncharacterized membrane protein YidH (DUF202 family)
MATAAPPLSIVLGGVGLLCNAVLIVLWALYRHAQSRLDRLARSHNPYEWMVDWSFYLAIVMTVVYCTYFALAIVARIKARAPPR